MDNMNLVNASEILNKVIGVATGNEAVSGTVDASQLIAVGTKLLRTAPNEFVNALSQVMSYTIFKTERPYRRKFNNILKTSDRWGNHVRKVGMISRDIIGDGQFSTTPWSEENMFSEAPIDEVIQTNYYGKTHFEIPWKQYKNQLDNALNGLGEFNSYYAMQMQTVNNDWEQAIENYSRLAILNMILGILAGGSTMQKVNLLAEYNKANGTALTKADVYKKENYTDFVRFAYAKIKTYMRYMTDRTVNFHAPFTDSEGKLIDFRRATPEEYMNLYILTGEYEQINARVLADTFNPEYIDSAMFERVNFWQDMANPSQIKGITTTYLSPSQEQTTSINAADGKDIFAVVLDDETVGMNLFDEWVAASPFEAHRGFINSYWHAQVRYWNSFEDNGIVFYLEDEAE